MEEYNFNIEEELSKIILANCLTSHAIIGGIRKTNKSNEYVLVSTVDKVKKRNKKKEIKNFYIPVKDIAIFLRDNFNNKQEFKNLNEMKKSFEKLLFSIYNEIGMRGLGIDGLCYYLGSHMTTELPGFKMSGYEKYKFSFDVNNYKKRMSLYKATNEFLNSDLYNIFDNCDILYDRSYEVEQYPITIEEQTKWAVSHGYSVLDSNNGIFIKIKDEYGKECNVVASMVNNETTANKYASYKLFKDKNVTDKYLGENKKWNDNKISIKPGNSLKYCNYCNGIYGDNKCKNITNGDILLDTSLEILNNKKEEQSNYKDL